MVREDALYGLHDQSHPNVMTLLPLHIAFACILKLHPRLQGLSFAALTVGSLVPDIEVVFSYLLGLSVFCGWDFPCTLVPDRLVLHSLAGAITVDVLLTFLFVKAIGKLKLQRIGIFGFTDVKFSWQFYGSAAIGSISHVLIDWMHHAANPIFWPLTLGQPPSHYVDGVLLPFMSVFSASFIVAIIGAVLTILLVVRAFTKSKYSISELMFNPRAGLSVLTRFLTRER